MIRESPTYIGIICICVSWQYVYNKYDIYTTYTALDHIINGINNATDVRVEDQITFDLIQIYAATKANK